MGVGCALPTWADSAEGSSAKSREFTGIAASVNGADRTVTMDSFWGQRRFNVGNDCQVMAPGQPTASLADLHPGQKLDIRYEDDHGIRVAHEIDVRPMTVVGDVRSVDPNTHVLVLRHDAHDKRFEVASDCRVELRENKAGLLSNIQPGDRVTITYESPDQGSVAHAIAQTSRTFTGSITAIDTNERMLKAKAMFGDRTFNLANDCRIVINGNPDAKLGDLRIGDQVTFNYDDEDGVLVANRVGRAGAPSTENPPVVNNQGGPVTPPMNP